MFSHAIQVTLTNIIVQLSVDLHIMLNLSTKAEMGIIVLKNYMLKAAILHAQMRSSTVLYFLLSNGNLL